MLGSVALLATLGIPSMLNCEIWGYLAGRGNALATCCLRKSMAMGLEWVCVFVLVLKNSTNELGELNNRHKYTFINVTLPSQATLFDH